MPRIMDFGINVATSADSWKVVKRAAELGDTRAWSVTFTGTRPELQERLRELRSAGYNHFAIRIAHGHPEMLEEWADVFAGV
jgi:hypothetical protein